MVGIFMVVTFILFLLVDLAVLRVRRQKAWPWQVMPEKEKAFLPVYSPLDCFYSPNHTWFKILSDGSLQLGLDSFLLRALGVPDEIKVLKKEKVKKGENFLRVKVGDKTLDIPATLNGRITAVNSLALSHPRVLFEKNISNWIVRMEAESVGEEAARSRIADRAKAWLREESERLRDFAIKALSPEAAEVGYAADGGMMVDGILREMDENIWKNFQRSFLNIEN